MGRKCTKRWHTLIMTYVHKHCSTQTHTLRVSMDKVEQAMRFAMNRTESGDIEGQAEGVAL